MVSARTVVKGGKRLERLKDIRHTFVVWGTDGTVITQPFKKKVGDTSSGFGTLPVDNSIHNFKEANRLSSPRNFLLIGLSVHFGGNISLKDSELIRRGVVIRKFQIGAVKIIEDNFALRNLPVYNPLSGSTAIAGASSATKNDFFQWGCGSGLIYDIRLPKRMYMVRDRAGNLVEEVVPSFEGYPVSGDDDWDMEFSDVLLQSGESLDAPQLMIINFHGETLA